MPADPENGDFTPCLDYRTIELRVLAFMTDNGPARRRAADRREGIVNAMMSGSPTGRRPSHPEMQRG